MTGTVEFNPLLPEVIEDPYPFYARLRASLAVAQPMAGALIFEPPGVGYEIGLIQDAVFEDKAEIAEVRLASFVPGMKMQACATFDVAFDESTGLGTR